MIEVDTPIAVVAPCSIYDEERLRRGMGIAAARGYRLEPLPGLLDPHFYLAAHDDVRAEQLQRALTSPDYGAVWVARGGCGMTRILDRLDFDAMDPDRPVIGFSDVTALLTTLHARRGGPIIHGPVVHSLPVTDDDSLDHLFAMLAGQKSASIQGERWLGGEAEGWLAGGNLCLLAATAGTGWQLRADGAILVLEEVGEAAFRIDRMLQQLESAGVFEGVRGVALGELYKCTTAEGWTLRDLLMERFERLRSPVLGDLPIGHGARNRAFPIGAPARIIHDTLTWDA